MSSLDHILGKTLTHLNDFTKGTVVGTPPASGTGIPHFENYARDGFNSTAANHSVGVDQFRNDFGGSWVGSRVKDANSLVEATGSSTNMSFKSHNGVLENMQQRLRQFDRTKDMAERFADGPGAKSYEDLLKKSQKELSKDAHKAYDLMAKAEVAHGKAVGEIAKRQEKVVSDMMKQHRKAWDASMKITNEAERLQYQKGLEHTLETRMDFLEHHFEELRKPHQAVLDHIGEARADLIEKSGITPKAKAAALSAENKAIQEAEHAAEGGMFSRLSKNLHETPIKTGAATLLGASGLLIGGKALAQDVGLLERPKGPDGEPQQGNFLMDAAITGAGLAGLMYAMRSGKGASAAMAH